MREFELPSLEQVVFQQQYPPEVDNSELSEYQSFNVDNEGEEEITQSFNIDFFAIAVVQFISLICVIVWAIYYYVNNAHSKDTIIGKSTAARIFIIFGEIIYLLLIIYVPVDVELKTRGEDAQNVTRWIWDILYGIQMILIWSLYPILFSFYDTDENRNFCKRILDAIRLQLPLLISIAILIIPTFFLANEVKIPQEQALLLGETANEEIDGEEYFVTKNTFVQHAQAVSVFLGQLFISGFGGIGIIMLPYNFLNDFIFRPKAISEANFFKRQRILLPKLINMRKEQKVLDQQRMQVQLMMGLQGYIRRYNFYKRMRILETCTILAEKEFQKLEDQANFNKRVDPLKYIWKLFQSFFTFCMAGCFLGILILDLINQQNLGCSGGNCSNPIDELGKKINDMNSQGDSESASLMLFEFLQTLLFLLSNLYIIWATSYGNKAIGQRHAFLTYYHMTENETLFNSFIANVAFKSIVTMGAIQYTTLIFFEWTKDSFIYRIAVFNQGSMMHITIAGTSIFDYSLTLSILCSLLMIAIRGSGRIRYNDAILNKEQRIKAEQRGEKIPKPKDILSMRFGEEHDTDSDADSDDDQLNH